MMGYIYVKRDTVCDRTAIQNALDEAAKLGRGTVILEGDFSVNGSLYVSDNTTVIIKNGTLSALDKSIPLIINSNCLLPRTRTLYGMQEGITITGENGCISGKIELFNVSDFSIGNLSFKSCEEAVSTAYVSGGQMHSLRFDDVKTCITAAIGTRNCTFTNITTEGENESIVFSSSRLENRWVNYFGPDVNNNIVRGLQSSHLPKIIGEYCYDILIDQ